MNLLLLSFIISCTLSYSLLPNYNLIGQGMNIFTNTRTHINLLNLTFSNKLIRDNINEKTYLVPDEISSIYDSKFYHNTHIITKGNDYLNYLMKKMKIKGKIGIPGFSFEGSSYYKNIENVIKENKNKYVISEDVIEIMKMKLIKIKITENIKKIIDNLPIIYDFDVYMNFIVNYGTHYIFSTVLGGTKTLEAIVSDKYYYYHHESHIIKESSWDFGIASGSNRYERYEQEIYKQWTDATNITTHVAGGDVTLNFNSSLWTSTIKESPIIISCELEPIYNLIENKIKANYVKKTIDYYIGGRNSTHNKINNCRHIKILKNKPNNFINIIGMLKDCEGHKYVYIIDGPNDDNECIASYVLKNENNDKVNYSSIILNKEFRLVTDMSLSNCVNNVNQNVIPYVNINDKYIPIYDETYPWLNAKNGSILNIDVCIYSNNNGIEKCSPNYNRDIIGMIYQPLYYTKKLKF